MFKVKITKKPNNYIGRIFKYSYGDIYRIENDCHYREGDVSYGVTNVDEDGNARGEIGWYSTPKNSFEQDLESGEVIWIK